MAVSFLIHPADSPFTTPVRRPSLVAIEGGRSAAAVRRRRTFLMRRVAVAALALVVLGTVVSIASSMLGAAPAPAASTASTYEVAAGDTLWSIAGSLHADADRREVIDLLADANGGTVVRPGQHLVIPAEVLALVG